MRREAEYLKFARLREVVVATAMLFILDGLGISGTLQNFNYLSSKKISEVIAFVVQFN